MGDEDDDEDLDDEIDEDEHEMERAALLAKSMAQVPLINNHGALKQKLADIVLNGGKKIPWVDNFSVLARTTAASLVEVWPRFYNVQISRTKEWWPG
jgi:hypothetical protein